MLTERAILELLERDPPVLQPLTFKPSTAPRLAHVDATYEVAWPGKQAYLFVAEVKARATPQVLVAAAHQAKSYAFDAQNALPLVIVPYLSPASLDEVEKLEVNAVDLCGNGVVQTNQWLVLRSGRPNRFRGTEPLRGAYRGVASLVARAFLVHPTFNRVSHVRSFIEDRGARITLATVSKALTRLEEDLVIAREADKTIHTVQADKLLAKLREGYRPPSVRAKLTLSTKISEIQLHRALRRASETLDGRLTLTGLSSASHQAVMASEPVLSFYCSARPDDLAKAASIDPRPNQRFANLELLQTDDERVYFDTRSVEDRILASPVQTWLELATGDKRSQEVADDLRIQILGDALRKGSHDGG